jgi:hypothetical protein
LDIDNGPCEADSAKALSLKFGSCQYVTHGRKSLVGQLEFGSLEVLNERVVEASQGKTDG